MVDSLAKCKLTKALVDPERELRMRIEYAAHWIRNHYRESSGGIPRGYISEQGGIPLTIVRANDNYSPRHNGIYRYRLPGVGLFQVYTRLAWTPPPNVGGRVDGEEYWDATHVTFDCCADVSTIIPFVDWAYNGPSIDVRRDYQTADKKTKVTLTFKGMDCTSHSVDLYWMDEKLATVNHNTPINTQWIRYTDAWGAFPSSKYTIRHGIQMAEKFWHSQGDEPKAAACRQTKTDHGYTCDIYDPMWGWKDTNGYDDDFMFCRTPFRDSEVGFDYEQNAHSHGLNPYRYGYESKVNFMNIDIPIDLAWVHEEWHVESVDIYIASLAVQSYGKALQAIHILNKYDDPDKEYDDVCMNRSVPDIWNRKKTTPRKVARYIEKHMMADNNIGVKSSDIRLPGPWDMHFSVPAFSKESWSASAYSTCAFHILESLLGYKYKDVTSKSYADIL
ncbi:MAG: hypothetical protein SVY53_10955, partial [Chloroflexota bacterium]|nr:hypothetical protein [Chloroflexota bacterium]